MTSLTVLHYMYINTYLVVVIDEIFEWKSQVHI